MLLHTPVVGSGPPLCVLHGMLGQGRNWGAVARVLSGRYTVLTPDLRNHGSSPRAQPMDYTDVAGDVADTLRAAGHTSAAVVGHSIGGKAAMVLALTRPEMVRALVVVDIAPVDYPPENLPLIRAMRAVDLGVHARRATVDLELARSVPDARVRAFLLQGLESGPAGSLAWRTDLAALEQSLGVLSGFPALDATRPYGGPTLFVRGALSRYVRPEHHPAVAKRFPSARHVEIPDAGHWVHADQPEAFVKVVGEFLTENGIG